MRKTRTLVHCCGAGKWCGHFGKQPGSFSSHRYHVTFSHGTSLPGVCPTPVHQTRRRLAAASFMVTETWRQPKCPSWTNRPHAVQPNNGLFFSHEDEARTHATTQMNLEDVTLSESSQTPTRCEFHRANNCGFRWSCPGAYLVLLATDGVPTPHPTHHTAVSTGETDTLVFTSVQK